MADLLKAAHWSQTKLVLHERINLFRKMFGRTASFSLIWEIVWWQPLKERQRFRSIILFADDTFRSTKISRTDPRHRNLRQHGSSLGEIRILMSWRGLASNNKKVLCIRKVESIQFGHLSCSSGTSTKRRSLPLTSSMRTWSAIHVSAVGGSTYRGSWTIPIKSITKGYRYSTMGRFVESWCSSWSIRPMLQK